MKILLTGTQGYRRGFIGNNFLRTYYDKYDIDEYEDDIRTGDFFNRYDMVIHLAAMAGVRKSHEEPELYWDVNVNGSKRLFDFYGERGVPVIYASSSSVYEWWQSPYATTKWAMESVASKESLGLRFHTVYGEDSRADMLYDMLLNKQVSYLTNHTRDWTHVEDICSAIDICKQNFDTLKARKAIDVGNGDPVSVLDLADHVWPGNELPLRVVDGERVNTCADPTHLLMHGWKPKHHILDPL
jgi:nucleoside-diphosphate-sugar epimerase